MAKGQQQAPRSSARRKMETSTHASARREPHESVAFIVEDVLGCKWMLQILGRIRRRVGRPGALRRSIPGLTTKVMNERLRKLVRFDVLEKRSFPERPPRVEYRLTAFGRRLNRLLDEIAVLDSARKTGRM